GYQQLRPVGAESRRTAAQQRYPFCHLTILDLDPPPIAGSRRTPVEETLVGRYRNQLFCPLIQRCVVSDERKQSAAYRQAHGQRRRMSQSTILSDGCAAPCQCLVRKAEAEKDNPQVRL